ncbi:MAG: tetratricopeptide repeat protein, partial [Myxococcales bacterium]|nr:tetratricopeptide repeat protein [Myxococcales bacterium]
MRCGIHPAGGAACSAARATWRTHRGLRRRGTRRARRRTRGAGLRAGRARERALRVNPNSTGALAELAELKRERGDLDESIRLYREALALNDSTPALYLALGDSLQRSGRYAEAESAFVRVLELDPDSFEARYNLGVSYGQQQRFDEAVRSYEAALARAPDHPLAVSALNDLAALSLARGERDVAIARFEQAVKASPSHFESRFNLGVQYLQAERVDEGIAMLEEALALQPNHEAANTTLAVSYLRVGRNQDACRALLMVRRPPRRLPAIPCSARCSKARRNRRDRSNLLRRRLVSAPPPARPPQPHECTCARREQQPAGRLGHEFDRPDVAVGYSVAIAVEGARLAALIRGGAARVVPGVDGR